MMTIGDTKQEHFTRPKEEYDRLLVVARAAVAVADDSVPVPYKGYEVGRETFEKMAEALAAVEDLL
jgi:predicted urease superfamily metal-dependent hydrolase